MRSDQTLASLKADFFSADFAAASAAADELGKMSGNEVVDFLIPVLESEDALQRNRAALALRNIGDSRAAAPLWRSIQHASNRNKRGTMVYALEKLDCSQELGTVFDLLFYGSYEVRMHAGTILDEQIFEFSETDLHIIQSKWDDLRQHPEHCPDFDACKDDIRHFVEGFTSYLVD